MGPDARAEVPGADTLEPDADSAGTHAIVVADVDGDTRLDVIMAQNENAFDKALFLATDEAAVDTAPPIVVNYEAPLSSIFRALP